MRKLKLVVSDFHIGNGLYRTDGTVNVLEDFVCDRQFIDLLEYYGQGEESSDGDLELIFNGDFFNMIQLMPEEQDLGILTERSALLKLEAILSGHAVLFDALRRFNAQANRRIVFILGNHDPQLLWKGVQDLLRQRIQGEIVFVDDVYRFDDVHVEHGHQLEPIFRMRRDRYFLTRGFPEPVLNLPWGVFFVTDYLYRRKRRRPYVDKVTPYAKFARWCLWNDFFFGWISLFLYFWFILKTRFSRLPLKRSGAFKAFGAILNLTRSPTLSQEVARIIERERCRIVILGHTHIPVHLQVGGGEYLNPGTWNDVTYLDIPNLGSRRRLGYVLIEYEGDRAKARLLEWHGFSRPYTEFKA